MMLDVVQDLETKGRLVTVLRIFSSGSEHHNNEHTLVAGSTKPSCVVIFLHYRFGQAGGWT